MEPDDRPATSRVYPTAGFGARRTTPASPSSDHDPAHTLTPLARELLLELCDLAERLAQLAIELAPLRVAEPRDMEKLGDLAAEVLQLVDAVRGE